MANNAQRVQVTISLYVTLAEPIQGHGWTAPMKTVAQGVVALKRPGVIGIEDAGGLYEPTDRVVDGWRICVRHVSAPFQAVRILEGDYRRLRSHWRGEWRKWQEPAGPDLFIGADPVKRSGITVVQDRLV